MNNIIAEIVGAMAYVSYALSYFKKQKKNILYIQIVAYILFSIHYFLFNGLTGMICNALGVIVLIVIHFFDKYKLKNKKLLVCCIVPAFIAISLVTYKDIFSVFPIVGSIFSMSSFVTNKERVIRGMGIVSTFSWLVYAVTLHSTISTIFEVITLVFVIAAFVKNEKKS